MSQELNSSELGTFDYWENIYADEINNFEDHGDVGEVWFGKNNAQKVVKCISEDLDIGKDDKIIDLGCGNGWTLVQLAKRGFKNLLGIDYAPKAVELAKSVINQSGIDISGVQVKVADILDDNHQLDGDIKLIHDKGTYDAISLSPEAQNEKRKKYIVNVHKLLAQNGCLVISSCNWTKDELTEQFNTGFAVIRVLETPAMTFGGKTGQSVTNIVFRKK